MWDSGTDVGLTKCVLLLLLCVVVVIVIVVVVCVGLN